MMSSPNYPRDPRARYDGQYTRWREVARSLPLDVDVDAAAAAFRDEMRQRSTTHPERSRSERRADR